MSSAQAVARVKRLCHSDKAGHGGTLDPFASGLLVVALAQATKFSQLALEADKTYLAEVVLGMTSSTGDPEGEIKAEGDPSQLSTGDIAAALAELSGDIDQTPPMHSALHHNGQRLYRLARQGLEVERPSRRVQVYEAALLSWDSPKLHVRWKVSKGTYIRELARQLGAQLGLGGYLASLRRVGIGPWDIGQAHTLEGLALCPPHQLQPLDSLCQHFPALELDPTSSQRLIWGQVLNHDGADAPHLRLYGPQGFIGLGQRQAGQLSAVRLLRFEPQLKDFKPEAGAE